MALKIPSETICGSHYYSYNRHSSSASWQQPRVASSTHQRRRDERKNRHLDVVAVPSSSKIPPPPQPPEQFFFVRVCLNISPVVRHNGQRLTMPDLQIWLINFCCYYILTISIYFCWTISVRTRYCLQINCEHKDSLKKIRLFWRMSLTNSVFSIIFQ